MEQVVFTNGCFDIVHPGHVDLLERARALGTRLIVGLNSDRSVRRIKGAPRPFVGENDRAAVLRGLRAVDAVVIFDESTPERLIKELRPDVLVKGGDWAVDTIVGADFVRARGGKVVSLPLKSGYSTTTLVERVQHVAPATIQVEPEQSGEPEQRNGDEQKSAIQRLIEESLVEHQAVFDVLQQNETAIIERCAEMLIAALSRAGKILICGNGGSASDAQHIAAEFVGRFERERRALPAIALTVDTSALTAISNDYGFERVFARQVEALARPGDVVIGLSTSGNSPNVLAAMMAARALGCQTIGLTGATGKKLGSICDRAILVPSARTARIQEAHITIGHIWCEIVDAELRDDDLKNVNVETATVGE